MTEPDQLAADTAMGAVTLNVADLDAMTAYYRDGGRARRARRRTGPRTVARAAGDESAARSSSSSTPPS